MHKNCSSPIIFALSNPTSRSELSAISNYYLYIDA